jgi:hypothetical protein
MKRIRQTQRLVQLYGVQALRDWAGKWGKYLLSLETGEVRPELAANI